MSAFFPIINILINKKFMLVDEVYLICPFRSANIPRNGRNVVNNRKLRDSVTKIILNAIRRNYYVPRHL